jgi:hypothetical protein
MGNIICIKASSHTNFELFLIGEKYDIPYKFLIKYKEDRGISKFWTEVGSGKVMAIEELDGVKKRFVSILPLSSYEVSEVKKVMPIISGKVLSKWRGDIESKEREFREMLEEERLFKEEMLNRVYDPSNIVCINIKLTNEQIFAICQSNGLDFVEVIDFKLSNYHIDLNKVWFEKETSLLVGYETVDNYFEFNEDALIPKKVVNSMSWTAVKTPKIKLTEENVIEYHRVKSLGFDLDIPKFENSSVGGKVSSDVDVDSFSIEDLENLLKIAIENEDYESAVELRDAINEIRNRNGKK